MTNRRCTTCVYAYWEPGQWVASLWSGFPIQPACANHPDTPGLMRQVPFGEPCRNYRPKPATPDGDVKRIPLGGGAYAYVDAADWEWLSRYHWHACNGGYAARWEKGRRIYMHREIMKPPKGKVVDHYNHNPADNCRINLRNCSRRENIINQTGKSGSASRFKGLAYSKERNRYYVRIRYKGRRISVGSFTDEVEAARAYDYAAVGLLSHDGSKTLAFRRKLQLN